jgi:hypothetical protein
MIALMSCGIEENQKYETGKVATNAQLKVSSSGPISVTACDFEDFAGPAEEPTAAKTAIYCEFTKGTVFQANQFFNNIVLHTETPDPESCAIYLDFKSGGGACRGATLLVNTYYGVETQLFAHQDCTEVSVLPQFQYNLGDGGGSGRVVLTGSSGSPQGQGRPQWFTGMVGWNGGCAILPGTGSTPNVWGTALGTAVGNITHPSLNTGGRIQSTRLIGGSTSGSTVNNQVTIFENQQHVWRGNAGGLGGFYLCVRVALLIDTTTSQFGFVGLRASTSSIGNTAPSNLTNIVGFGCDPGDGNVLHVFHNSTSTATKVSLGADYPTQKLVQLELYCQPNGSAVLYRATRLDDDSVLPANGVLSSNLPSNATFMAFHVHANTGASGTEPAAWRLARALIECDV